MCGITGLVSLDSRQRIDPDLLGSMTDSLAHRGPDGRGVWIGENAGLGHRRLAIIDPEGGAQPLVIDNGKYVFVYNGELYNHIELKKILESAGFKFHSRCDTEVALYALIHWGVEEALHRFRGMFAFALWEKEQKRLTLARDPIGVKPLYWAMRNGLIRFGSEIKTILTDKSFPRTPDTTAIVNYLAHYRLSFQGKTFFRNINEVSPGTFITWEGKRRKEKRYWTLPAIPESEKVDAGSDNVAQEFRERMIQSVRRRLIADVPVGGYLSGGIDSSVLVLLMKELKKSDLETFSIGFPEEGYNEFQYSAKVAQALGVPHQQVTLTEQGYFKEFDQLIKIKDTPMSVPNEVPLRFLSRVLKNKIKVVLSGEGADELLGGYTFLVRSPHDFLLAKAIEEGSGSFDSAQKDRIKASLNGLYGRSSFDSQQQQFLPLYQWMTTDERSSLFRESSGISSIENEISGYWEETWAGMEGNNLDPYEKVLHVLEQVHLSALLLRLDATTMAEGVEGRVPYTDIDLVEWVAKLPVHYKVRWKGEAEEKQAAVQTAVEVAGKLDQTKYLLRLAFAGEIPDEIIVRPKAAFPVPLDKWFFGTWQNWAFERILTAKMGSLFNLTELEKFISSSRGKDEGMKIWMLANIGTWLEMYF
ncbi:MAG: asparagine synthase (glutamine-hydrolyzing) [Candidatus Electryonea clarkiae]|nr:asparagine synthase (glutamine-hydrolyzing) [Candidatus Electryonea clarkiae]MDP8286095.1 asparagine synthase (glutamine-hydrolyzing) [Candidatus Electryonea clarkiae]